MKMKRIKERKWKWRSTEALVAVCILLIARNLSGGLESLPSDQHPASLALSLRKRRRKLARVLHIFFTQQHVTYSRYLHYSTMEKMLEDIFEEWSWLLFRVYRFFKPLKYTFSVIFFFSQYTQIWKLKFENCQSLFLLLCCSECNCNPPTINLIFIGFVESSAVSHIKIYVVRCITINLYIDKCPFSPTLSVSRVSCLACS